MAQKTFNVFNYTLMFLTGMICLLPFVHLLAVSFSDQYAVNANLVGLWPVNFTTKSYEFVFTSSQFITAFGITIKRAVLGVAVNLLLITPCAYALSKTTNEFSARNVFAWYFVITILFSSSLVPWYLVIRATKIMDTIWALILPGAVPVWSMLILMNYIRGLPKEVEEAAFIDGADYFTILLRIVLPVCTPALATVFLFAMVNHWNAWFDGLLLMNRVEHYPLQSYLQTIIINPSAYIQRMARSGDPRVRDLIKLISIRGTRAAQLFIATFPILCVYPFVQKYFTKGLVLGSVKG